MAKQSTFQWQLKQQPDEKLVLDLQKELAISPLFAAICVQRGITSKEAFDLFINPSTTQLHDPFLMHDMEKGVTRIRQAIENGEHILVYGDYDADGITSTTILYEAIENLGGQVRYYIPNRFTDGYGPNRSVYRYMIEQENISLIVTVDNGVSGHEAIAYANSVGVDVVVTDHHEIPSELPDAFAIIHPRHPNGNYPFGQLAGVGVAFKVAQALLGEIPYEVLDLVAIGTVADLVPLIDENRIFVKFGIEHIKQTQRIGLQLLMESVKVELSALSAETIGFSIGPRLNAIGRLDDATIAVELMTTFDEEHAAEIIQVVELRNSERKQIVEQITQEVMLQVKEPYPSLILLSNPNWHAGVLGIVASRIVELTNRPTILLQENVETGTAKGSGRSVEGINLYEYISEESALLVAFGGHDMAAGMTISVDKILTFKEKLQSKLPVIDKRLLAIDIVTHTDVTVDQLHEMKQLEPYGNCNARPIILFENVTLQQVKAIGTNQQHLKGQLDKLDFIQFNVGQGQHFYKIGTAMSVVGQLSINEWNGIEKAQLNVMDIQISGQQFFDHRASKIKQSDVTIQNATYVCFHQKTLDMLEKHIPQTSQVILSQNMHDADVTVENLVLFDLPNDTASLKAVLSRIKADNIYVMFYPNTSAYLLGNPTREQFAKLFKYLSKMQSVAVHQKIDEMSQRLKIKKELLILMIRVFLEANFVTITEGVMTLNHPIQPVELMQTNVMKQHTAKIAVEKQLLYTQFDALVAYLKQIVQKEEA